MTAAFSLPTWITPNIVDVVVTTPIRIKVIKNTLTSRTAVLTLVYEAKYLPSINGTRLIKNTTIVIINRTNAGSIPWVYYSVPTNINLSMLSRVGKLVLRKMMSTIMTTKSNKDIAK